MRFFRNTVFAALAFLSTGYAQDAAPQAAVQPVQNGPRMRQIAIIDLPGKPGYDAMALANGMVLMSHSAANTVDIFDPVRRRMVAQVQGVAEPRGIAVDPNGKVAYIAGNANNTITVLDTSNWSIKGVIGLKHAPESLLLVPGTDSLLVSNPLSRSVSVVSTESLGKKEAELAVIDVHGKPQQFAWNPAERRAYLTVEDGSEVIVLDPTNPETTVAKRFKLDASQPTGIVFDTKSQQLFVAVRYAVLQIDATTGNEIARAAAAAGTDSLWLDDASRTLYAAAGNGFVNIYSVSGKIDAVNEFRADVRGHAIAFDPATKMMYLGGGREGKSKVLILKQANGLLATEAQTAENR
jgi:DNA-binding beta-propeller fold protein YncE